MMVKDQASPIRWLWPLCAGFVLVIGCAEVKPEDMGPTPAQRALIGKPKEAVLACAGAPVHERVNEVRVILVYYREASQFEESFAGSKGSYPRVHHGCRATITIMEDRVKEVRYEGDPDPDRDQDHCEDMFEPCISP